MANERSSVLLIMALVVIVVVLVGLSARLLILCSILASSRMLSSIVSFGGVTRPS